MVYFRMYGRLGNLLFQYAAAMSLGRGAAIGVTDDPAVVDLVRRTPDLFHDLQILPSAPAGATVFRQHRCDYLPLPKAAVGDVFLDGYFQSDRYFDEDRVRSLFAMRDDLRMRLMRRYGEILARPGVTSVHVRRGDYLRLPQFHPFVGEKYFRRCLARLPEAGDFIVCSDDLPWCRDFFGKAFPARNFHYSEETDPVADMYLCSLCRNHILSNSSFSWWGGWLDPSPGKRVLAPSVWFGHVLRRGHLDWSSLYAEGTEIVDNRHSPAFWLAAHWPPFAKRV